MAIIGTLVHELAILLFNYDSGDWEADYCDYSGKLYTLRFRGAVTEGDYLYLSM